MTGNDAPSAGSAAPGGDPVNDDVPSGPPWPLELLADLHAGVFDDSSAATLRSRVLADADARATLAALDATRAALADLPPLRMPDEVAARIGAALREEASRRAATSVTELVTGAPRTAHPEPPDPSRPTGAPSARPGSAPVADLAAARERRRRRLGLPVMAGLLTAAAAVAAIIVVPRVTGDQTGGGPHAAPTADSSASDQPLPPLAVSRNNLGTALSGTLSVVDYGPLAAAGRLDACLSANRLDPVTTRPLGAREVTLDGTPGILLILPAGTARFRLLVVSTDCGPGNPAVLADTTVGR
jgi:hypothetical protein